MLPGTVLVTVSGLLSIATPEMAETEHSAANRPVANADRRLARPRPVAGDRLLARLPMATFLCWSRELLDGVIIWPPRWPAVPRPRGRCCHPAHQGCGCWRRCATSP